MFARVVEAVSSYLRSLGFFIHVYLDDWSSRLVLVDQTHFLIEFYNNSAGKCISRYPSSRPPRVSSSRSALPHSAVSSGSCQSPDSQVPPQNSTSSICHTYNPTTSFGTPGIVKRSGRFIHLGRLTLRLLQLWLHFHWDPLAGDWDRPLQVDAELLRLIAWWIDEPRLP